MGRFAKRVFGPVHRIAARKACGDGVGRQRLVQAHADRDRDQCDGNQGDDSEHAGKGELRPIMSGPSQRNSRQSESRAVMTVLRCEVRSVRVRPRVAGSDARVAVYAKWVFCREAVDVWSR